jgi:hypothetical protein
MLVPERRACPCRSCFVGSVRVHKCHGVGNKALRTSKFGNRPARAGPVASSEGTNVKCDSLRLVH